MSTHYDTNSNTNQEIKRKFVEREIICNVNAIAEFCLKSEDSDSPYQWDEFTNLYAYTFTGKHISFYDATEEQKEEALQTLRDEINVLELLRDTQEDETVISEMETKLSEMEEEYSEAENSESEMQEIFEYWLVSNYLAEKLQEQGEPVIIGSYGAPSLWGRTTSGQAILLDGVISQICTDMEILEGMAHSWETK